MGRKSLIPQIESKYKKPIKAVLVDLAAQGNVNHIVDTLGISKSLVYDLLEYYEIQVKKNGHKAEIQGEGELLRHIESFVLAKEIGGKTPDTLRFYDNNLRRFAWWLDQAGIPLELESLTPDTIRRFLHYFQTETHRFTDNNRRVGKVASRSMLDAYWRTFQAFCTWLIREGLMEEFNNPIRKVDRPKQLKVVVPDIPKETLIKLLDSFGPDFLGKRNKAILLVFLDSGVRLSELVGMKLSDLNQETGIIKVFGKGQKERLVRVSQLTISAVKDYLETRYAALGDSFQYNLDQEPPWLWVKENGHKITRGGVSFMVTQLKKIAPPGVKISPHVFRHTFAINYLRGNGTPESRGDPFTLQMLGGWEDLDMPRRYAAALKQEDALKVHEKASPVTNLLGGG